MSDYTFGQVLKPLVAIKKCPNCKKKGHMKLKFAEAVTELDTTDGACEFWMNVPYHMCKKCKVGTYDIRAHIMESVAVMWVHEDSEDLTEH